MAFSTCEIPGLLIFEPEVFEDSRGYFFEAYNQEKFSQGDARYNFVQDNQSKSSYGVIRGLHYQLNPSAQAKLVRVLDGCILDVAVDIRKDSPTFGRHFSIELSAANKRQLLLPEGFAHGFSVLSQSAIVLYKCNSFYDKSKEGGIRFDDPQLGIDWKVERTKAVVSEKDSALPSFRNCDNNF
jgi:dTDP-4-dehydrorhamnose 3,5-epimerase